MSHACQSRCAAVPRDHGYRRVLWIALAINAGMFAIEVGAGLHEGSVSLQADALDFFGDAVTYGLSLYVLARTVVWRASAGVLKGGMMAVFGLWIMGAAVYKSLVLGAPSAFVMGSVGIVALVANFICAALLFRHRNGEINRRSVWICSRNDALGNLAVVIAASGVFATGTPWPDILVGISMAALGLSGAYQIIRQGAGELRTARAAVA